MARTISVAMIVKDESEQLAECLAGLRGLADEIRIVDTGSRDNTVEIARQNKAFVTFFIWCDDFSAARNESLRGCKGDWVLVLDADERLAPEDLAKIRTLADGLPQCGYRFVTRNYTNTESVDEFHRCAPGDPFARGFAGWYPSVKVRMFPNNAGARFEGKVHELVHKSLESRGLRIVDCDVPIHHYPYTKSPDRLVQKQAMYIQLGLQKIAVDPSDPKSYAELGNQYAEMSDYVGAAGAYRDSLKRDPSNPVVLKDLGGVLHLLKRSEDGKRALKLALELDPNLTEAWRNLGVIYADEKAWPVAIECFERCLALDPEWTDGHRYLSISLEGEGRIEEAAKESRTALEANPASALALSLYIHHMLRLEKRPEARECIKALIDKGNDSPAMLNALGELYYYDHLLDEAVEHFQLAAQSGIAPAYNNLGVAFYRLQRYAEARDAFEKCLAIDATHRGARANLEKALKHLH